MFKKTENQRIRDEILLILKERFPLNALKRMKELHELRFIHGKIVLNKGMEKTFKTCSEIYPWYNENYPRKRNIDLYLMYLMVLTDGLNLKQIKDLCAKFVFKRNERIRLIAYKKNCRNIISALSSRTRFSASRIYKILEPVSYEAILVILAKTKTRRLKRRIYDFLEKYNGTKIKVRGDDLKKMGLKEGPHFKDILTKILYAKLDGKVRTKKEELAYLRGLIRGIR